MEFIEFIHLLKSVIGEGKSTSDFTKVIFDNLISDDASYLLDNVSDSSYKAYYNGTTKITRFAQKITCYVDRISFEEYLDSYEESTLDLLIQKFCPYIDNLNLHNVSTEVTTLFIDILLTEAGKNRKTNKNKTAHSELDKKILESGKVMVDVLGKAMEAFANNMNDEKDIKTEVIDEIPSGNQNTTIIQNQTNVIQNGDNNTNITNTGNITFNIGGNKNEQ